MSHCSHCEALFKTFIRVCSKVSTEGLILWYIYTHVCVQPHLRDSHLLHPRVCAASSEGLASSTPTCVCSLIWGTLIFYTHMCVQPQLMDLYILYYGQIASDPNDSISTFAHSLSCWQLGQIMKSMQELNVAKNTANESGWQQTWSNLIYSFNVFDIFVIIMDSALNCKHWKI